MFLIRPTYAGILLIPVLITTALAFASPWAEKQRPPTPEEKLGAAGIELSTPALVTTLQDGGAPARLRYASAVVLGRSGDSAALPVLVRMLADNDVPSDIRSGCATGLGFLGDPAAIPELRTALLEERDNLVRLGAVQGLAGIGTEEAIAALLAGADTPWRGLHNRVSVVLRIGHLEQAASAPGWKALLENENAPVRTAAAISMARLGDTTAVPHLVKSVLYQDEENWQWLTMRAAKELETLAGREFDYAVADNHASAETREAALHQLYEWWIAHRREYGN